MPPSLTQLKLQVLSEISTIIHKALDLGQALKEALRILSASLAMERATVTMLDRDTGELVIMASHGLTEEERRRGVYKTNEGATGKIFRTATPLHIPNVCNEPLFLNKTRARDGGARPVSYTGVPIILGNETIGVLSVDRLFGEGVDVREDIDFLNVVATLLAQMFRISETVRRREEELRRENVTLKYQISKETRGLYIVGASTPMQEVERQIEKVAPTKATVLLLGESGTGKTLIARIIHDLSERKAHPFVKVNCASIPENLLESELFGYEKGAFTGATSSKPGRFEDAHRGSIFLDEIGELPLPLQSKLLRVIQEREFERIGGNRTQTVDVRILAATNRDLRELVDQGEFRLDLYYRLNVFPITVPPLRRRKEDVPGLLNHFLRKMAHEYGRNLFLTPGALDFLTASDWPGNVRELEHLVERLVIMAEGDRIDETLVRLALDTGAGAPAGHAGPAARATLPHDDGPQQRKPSLKEMERAEIISALREAGWIKRRAAETLGLTERQIGYRIRKFDLEDRVAAERMRLRNAR